MCGIVGAVAERDVVPVLMEGLRRLEYRGYDSAGIAVLNGTKHLTRLRTVGKVRMLDEALEQTPTAGKIGIAHTRWATHGVPSERNAHPHISRDGLAIVHNGIIENHEELRADLERRGYRFSSETDTEVIAHRVHYHLQTVKDLFKAVRATVAELEGAYALAVVSEHEPERLIVAREGCPVVLGLGKDENFVASDVAALLPVTRRFVFLEEGDVAEVRRRSVRVLARHLQRPRELAGARVGARDADARGTRDRRRVHQGLHDPARRARHAGDRARAPQRRRRRARARARHAPHRAAGARGEDTRARCGHSAARGALCRPAPRAAP